MICIYYCYRACTGKLARVECVQAGGLTLATPHLCAPADSMNSINFGKFLNCSMVGLKHIMPPSSKCHDILTATTFLTKNKATVEFKVQISGVGIN